MTYIKYIIKYLKFKKNKVYLESIRDAKNISMKAKYGKNIKLLEDVIVKNNVTIGDYTYINKRSIIINAEIGRFCSIGYNCIIGPENHPIETLITHPIAYDKNYEFIKHNNYYKFKDDKKNVVIEDNVWIGANATIMGGVTIGEGAIIAANSVVTKNVEAYDIVGGIPSKKIKNRKIEYNLKDIKLKDMKTDIILKNIVEGNFK